MNRNTKNVPFSKPNIGKEEEKAVLSVLRSGWLTTGRQVKEFEKEMGKLMGAKHTLAVNSATAGLHLALEALGIGPGDLVAVPTLTFTATAEVIRYLGADPVFIDVEKDGFNLSIDHLRVLLQKHPKIKGVIPVHMGGLPCPMSEIKQICRKHKAFLIEDAAHAFPSFTPHGKAGLFGDVGVFSFYANKTMTTGEGGMILTHRDDLAQRMAVMRLHGINRDAFNRYQKVNANWEYDVVAPGYKYNMTDIAAAIGREQLKKVFRFKEDRTAQALRYNEAFGDLDFLETPPDGPGNAWHLYIIRLNPDSLSIDRNAFIQELNARGVGTSVHYKPLHLMSYYKKRYNIQKNDLKEASKLYNRIISLPLYHGLTRKAQNHVIKKVREIGIQFRK